VRAIRSRLATSLATRALSSRTTTADPTTSPTVLSHLLTAIGPGSIAISVAAYARAIPAACIAVAIGPKK
jgi:hypothetical protein